MRREPLFCTSEKAMQPGEKVRRNRTADPAPVWPVHRLQLVLQWSRHLGYPFWSDLPIMPREKNGEHWQALAFLPFHAWIQSLCYVTDGEIHSVAQNWMEAHVFRAHVDLRMYTCRAARPYCMHSVSLFTELLCWLYLFVLLCFFYIMGWKLFL